jgi:hypothetical protein
MCFPVRSWGVSGLILCFAHCRPLPFVLSKEGLKTQKRVWDELNAKLEKIQPGILADI